MFPRAAHTAIMSEATSHEIFLGRQPILDRSGRLVAYELLFRAGHANAAAVTDDALATSSVLRHAFADLGLQSVLGGCRGFVNFDAEMLLSDVVELLPKSQIVLELLETVAVDETIVARCRALKAAGFTLALDDFVFDERYRPLLEIVDIVKVDLLLHDAQELAEVVRRLRQWPVKLLAEKVDSKAQADYCHDLGFELFQGYYFAKPAILTARRTDPASLTVMRLLGLVMGDAESHAIEAVFKENPNLTYNLMRLVNSAASGMPRRVGSVGEAIIVLGRRHLQRWLQLLLFSLQQGSPHPSPLLMLAAGRGKLMELLAGRLPAGDSDLEDRAFMAGIMSLLDVLLERPLADICAEIGLADDVRAALLGREGMLGTLLRIAELCETADAIDAISALAESLGLAPGDVGAAEIEAFKWVNDIALGEV
jgi:EAL and modified HD-GYP domain-containing signal transduction protein